MTKPNIDIQAALQRVTFACSKYKGEKSEHIQLENDLKLIGETMGLGAKDQEGTSPQVVDFKED